LLGCQRELLLRLLECLHEEGLATRIPQLRRCALGATPRVLDGQENDIDLAVVLLVQRLGVHVLRHVSGARGRTSLRSGHAPERTAASATEGARDRAEFVT